MRKVVLLILLIIISIYSKGQLLQIGKTREEIKSVFREKMPIYIYQGENYTDNGVSYISFETPHSDAAASYYFTDNGICYSLLIIREKKYLSNAIQTMNQNNKKLDNLTWINESGTILYQIEIRSSIDMFGLTANLIK